MTSPKPGKHQGPDSTAILPVEDGDIALIGERKMLDAVREVGPNGLQCGVEEVRFVDTSIPAYPPFRDSQWMSAQRLDQPDDIIFAKTVASRRLAKNRRERDIVEVCPVRRAVARAGLQASPAKTQPLCRWFTFSTTRDGDSTGTGPAAARRGDDCRQEKTI